MKICPARRWLPAVLLALFAAGCGIAPEKAAPPPGRAPEQFHVDLGGGISVDYQIERKTSSLNSRACYAFITGYLVNRSGETLSRRTVIDFNVFGGGRQLFRDLTSPVQDVPPDTQVMFEMVDSPVHKEGCPAYERIEVKLRKVTAG